jgi:hypothetical protein
MAKEEFLDNVRVARGLFAHPRVCADSSALDTEALQRGLVPAAIWLTPKSVQGFRSSDFEELGPTRQQELSDAIQDFLRVARQVPPTTAQLEAASTAFGMALSILQPYFPTHEEWRKSEEALGKIPFPPWVANWVYEFGSDEDGSPIVVVTVYADEQSAPRQQFGRIVSELTGKIGKALSAAGIIRWPYVRMRTALEYKTA